MYLYSLVLFIMLRWAEPRRHTVVCSFVCVRNAYLSNRLLLSAEIGNSGTSQYFMKKFLTELRLKVLFSSYGVICSPGLPLQAFGLPSETVLSTAGYIALDL